MLTFESTGLWQRTLAARKNDPATEEREKLRAAFISFRERAALLAQEIARDLPDFTVHDVTHLDALWQMADLIAGAEYQITPTEAFVLGGAFLTHDLGNGLAAYPEGVKEMYASATWNDALSLTLRKKVGRAPTPDEVKSADEEVKRATTAQVLRTLHARHAERLAQVSWRDPTSSKELFLIQDDFLRTNYGRLIGRVAHSHWWDIARLKPEFDTSIGAPVGYPSDWTIDPLKIACLLRVADAAHLDARRAPPFVKAIRVKNAGSVEHWNFQEKLQQPMRNGDRIVYSSASPFKQAEASSWWLCFEALQALDRELAGSDAMLADCARARFAVRGVQGAEDAHRLTRWVNTDGWAPVDTRIKASNVALLASRLGGAQLYGHDLLVPLRELIQNAGDAIRARRYLENRSGKFGEIAVRTGSDSAGHWIEVADNGVGMSESVITSSLLDFGSPFWNSERMIQELPGLASSPFEPTGKYGIGFFSLFMWGDHVRVTSRRYDEGATDTRVLEFTKGLETRPILRAAHSGEVLLDAGTEIRVWLTASPEQPGGVLYRQTHSRRTIEEICEWLCPAIDTDVSTQRQGSGKKLVVGASDWRSISGEQLLARLAEDDTPRSQWSAEQQENLIKSLGPNLRTIKNDLGEIVGRVAVNPNYLYNELGAITDGGLRVCAMFRIAGILQGSVTTAARKTATPVVSRKNLAEWATAQRPLIASMEFNEWDKSAPAYSACTIGHCGGDIGDLPVAESARGWLSLKAIRRWKPLPDEILLVERDELDVLRDDLGEIKLDPNVLVCEATRPYFIQNAKDDAWPDPETLDENPLSGGSNQAAIVRLLSELWGATVEEVASASTFSKHPDYKWATIGKIGRKKIERTVHVIRNPRLSRRRAKTSRATK